MKFNNKVQEEIVKGTGRKIKENKLKLMHVLRDNGKVQGKGNLKEKREKKK